MKVLIVEPPHLHRARGNAITVRRWVRGLANRSIDIWSARPDDLEQQPAPEIVHAHHAVHSGPSAAIFAAQHRVPLVVSLGGTDLNGGPEGETDVRGRRTLCEADMIVGPFPENAERIRRSCPRIVAFRAVRRGIELPDAPAPPLPHDGSIKAVLAGGLRPAKGQLEAIDFTKRLRAAGIPVSLDIFGPIIDADYADAVKQAAETEDAIQLCGEQPVEKMAEVYADADILMNSSPHEGASNAILEAWSQGRPVLAREAPGNREYLAKASPSIACSWSPVHSIDTVTSWLEKLRAASPTERMTIAQTAWRHVSEWHDAKDELDELIAAYHGVLGR